jgi:hypothetical protein
MGTRPGFNDVLASDAIDVLISGGAEVRLFTSELNYDDNATDLDSKEVSATDYSSVSVAEADWTVTADVANQETTLENANIVDFGTAQNNWGVVVDAAIFDSGTDRFIIADEVNDPDITSGEDVRFPSGEISYTLG